MLPLGTLQGVRSSEYCSHVLHIYAESAGKLYPRLIDLMTRFQNLIKYHMAVSHSLTHSTLSKDNVIGHEFSQRKVYQSLVPPIALMISSFQGVKETQKLLIFIRHQVY